MPSSKPKAQPLDLDRLYDGQRRIEDKVTDIQVKIASIPDHTPRLLALEQGAVDAKVSMGQAKIFGAAGLVLLPILVSILVHFLFKGL